MKTPSFVRQAAVAEHTPELREVVGQCLRTRLNRSPHELRAPPRIKRVDGDSCNSLRMVFSRERTEVTELGKGTETGQILLSVISVSSGPRPDLFHGRKQRHRRGSWVAGSSLRSLRWLLLKFFSSRGARRA